MIPKVLIVNGSPKGKKSNTLKIATAFAEGIGSPFDVIHVNDLNLEHCRSCYSCWIKNPGVCEIKDDFNRFMDTYKMYDVVIWSVPIFAFGVPSKTKILMDRNLSQNLPYIVARPDGTDVHPMRFDRSELRQVLVSTSGYYSEKNNYEGMFEQFRLFFHNDDYQRIIFPGGSLFDVDELRDSTDRYLDTVRKAGAEYVSGGIREETAKMLSVPLISHEEYKNALNSMWDSFDVVREDRIRHGIDLKK